MFIWLQSIFSLSQSVGEDSTHNAYGRIGLKTLKSIHEISVRVQQTHPIGFRSACTSLLFQILVGPLINRSEVFSNSESLVNLISKLRLQELLQRSSTRNIINLLEKVEIKSFQPNLEKDARYNAVGFFLANESPNMRLIRSHFDSDATNEIKCWIKILAEYQIFSPSGSKSCYDEPFGISFFEFIFRTFKEKTVLDHQTAEILADLADTILHVLPKNLIQLTLSKIISCARTLCGTGDPDKIAYALCLLNVGISSDHHSEENFSLIQKMAKDFYRGGKFDIRPKTEVHFSIMKWSWKLLYHVVKFYSHHDDDQLIHIGEDALPKMNPNGQIYVFQTILEVLEKSPEISENFGDFLTAAWQSVLVAMHSDKFSSMYQLFVHMVIHRRTISKMPSVVENFGEKIFEKSKTKTGLVLPLVQRLYQIQIMDGNGLLPFKQTPNLIYKILFYNDAHRKDLEIYKTIQERISKLKNFVDFIEERIEVEDETSLVRIVAIQMMLRFADQSEIDQSNDRIELINEMLSINKSESRKKTKYYIDSSTHRNKERCFQYILLILLNDNFYMKMKLSQSRDICQDLILSLINDEQSSISALQQICIALTLNFALSQGEDFWSEFCLPHIDRFGDNENTGRSVSVSGLLIAGFLFAQTQPEDSGSSFLLEMIPKLIRLQQSNNYVVRIYAIGILQSVYNWFQKRNTSVLNTKFPFLADHVGYSMKVTTGNVGKNVTRVISNSFLKEFQVKKCALITIFNTLPRIFGSKSFLLINQLKELESPNNKISLDNPETDFETDDETESGETIDNGDEVEEVDNGQFCQQKVTPWMMDENDENLKDEQGLIVCCSLIDKPNNLGGITRTAEVFGATELIFDNLKVLNDKNYTSLAVTGYFIVRVACPVNQTVINQRFSNEMDQDI